MLVKAVRVRCDCQSDGLSGLLLFEQVEVIGGCGVEQQRAELVGRGGRVALHLGGGQLAEQLRQAAALDEPGEQDSVFFKYLNSSPFKKLTGMIRGFFFLFKDFTSYITSALIGRSSGMSASKLTGCFSVMNVTS